MELIEFFVEYVQWLLPTWFLLLGVRVNMLIVGFKMRSGDCVVQQIKVDREDRKVCTPRPALTLFASI
jgi:hypothetical protein